MNEVSKCASKSWRAYAKKITMSLCGLIFFKQDKLYPNQLGLFSGAHGWSMLFSTSNLSKTHGFDSYPAKRWEQRVCKVLS